MSTNYGPWFDVQAVGLYSVIAIDSENWKEDLSSTQWTYQVGLEGEFLGLQNVTMANSSIWTHQGSDAPINQTLIWYKAAPEGKGPVSLNLAGMGKGQAWVNSPSVGRYWSSYLSPSTGCSESCDYRGTYDASKCPKKCGQPAQTLYHVPRSWLQPGENYLSFMKNLAATCPQSRFKLRGVKLYVAVCHRMIFHRQIHGNNVWALYPEPHNFV